MAAASGFQSAISLHTFLKDTPTTGLAATGIPTTTQLGTKYSATKLGSGDAIADSDNRLRGIITLGTIDKVSNSIEFFIYGERSSERIPGIASTQQFTLGWAMNYSEDDGDDNIFSKWRVKEPGDYIEGVIITASGNIVTAAAATNALATTGLNLPNLTADYFRGQLSGTSFNFGSQGEPSNMNFTVDLVDPFVHIHDATA